MAYGSGGYGSGGYGGGGYGPLSTDASNTFYGKVRVSGVLSNPFYGKVRVSGVLSNPFYGKVIIGTGRYITAYFSSIGVPTTGLTPTINIWNINGYHEVDSGTMYEIGDGWYKYLFANYVDGVGYVRTADGGAGLPVDERYNFNAHNLDSITTGRDWGATEREQIRDALGVDGDKTKSTGGVMQKIRTAVDAVISFVS